jgi:hypothetical protein
MVELPAGNGRLWLSSLAADRSWSDWPITPFFLLIQQELLRIAAGRNQPVLAATVGGSVHVPWPENTLQAEFELRSPTGKLRKTVAQRRQTADPFVIGGFEEPGVFALSRGNDTRQVAVNLAPDESDLTYLPVAGLAGPLAPASVFTAQTWEEHVEALRLARSGRPMWPGLLTAALLIAVLEHLLANLRSRQVAAPGSKFSFAVKGAARAAAG